MSHPEHLRLSLAVHWPRVLISVFFLPARLWQNMAVAYSEATATRWPLGENLTHRTARPRGDSVTRAVNSLLVWSNKAACPFSAPVTRLSICLCARDDQTLSSFPSSLWARGKTYRRIHGVDGRIIVIVEQLELVFVLILWLG